TTFTPISTGRCGERRGEWPEPGGTRKNGTPEGTTWRSVALEGSWPEGWRPHQAFKQLRLAMALSTEQPQRLPSPRTHAELALLPNAPVTSAICGLR
ncbi:hypothetical protein WDZ92_52640, partial [Nostoc sp. NIES-2111]